MQIIKPDVNINFVGRRKIAFVLSLAVIIASFAALIIQGGPKLGIDFAGGAEMYVRFDQSIPIAKVKSALKATELQGTVQKYGTTDDKDYRILIQADENAAENLAQKAINGLEKETGAKVDRKQFQFEMVGPQVGRDLREKALLAIFFSLMFITVYISGRFEFKWMISAVMAAVLGFGVYGLYLANVSIPWLMLVALVVSLVLFWFLNLKYAMGAIVALVHDVLITIGMFSFAGKEFTLPIIAAILTIIGYSLNDTIIVFDRIRENMRKYHRQPLTEIINKSVNETLSRTLLTSLTTLFVVACLFALGGGIIHDFAFALLVGIIVGTYSSIFVASPILLAWQGRK